MSELRGVRDGHGGDGSQARDSGVAAPGSDGRQMRVCPRCGASLFADMDVCYGCLYDFSRSHGGVGDGMPPSADGEGRERGSGKVKGGCGPGGARALGPGDTAVRAWAPGVVPVRPGGAAVPAGGERAEGIAAPGAPREAGRSSGASAGNVGASLACAGGPAAMPVGAAGGTGAPCGGACVPPGDRGHDAAIPSEEGEIWGSLDEVWDDEGGAGGAEADDVGHRSDGTCQDDAPCADDGCRRADAEGPHGAERRADACSRAAAGSAPDACGAVSRPLSDAHATMRLMGPCPAGTSAWVRVSAPGMAITCAVPEDGLVVGRDADSDLSVASMAVSRHHLRLLPEGQGVLACDLGAKNPALLNGRPLVGDVLVGAGDIVEIRGSGVTICVPEGRGVA